MKRILQTLLLFVTFTAFGQKESEKIKEIAQNLNTFAELPQEKVYLSTDKPYYAPNETMFFKAFVVNAVTHEPTVLSAVLMVDVYRSSDKFLVKTLKLPIESGTATGTLDWEFGSGEFLVHAYTQWMRNISPDFHFQKSVSVLNMTPSVEAANSNQNIALKFFPEGGQCVDGLPCKMAFKATDSKGRGIAVNGAISDKEGTGVAIFKDEYLGMGSFGFTPSVSKQYIATVTLPNGSKAEFPLPETSKSGYVLSVENLRDTANIKVNIRTNLPDNKLPAALYLITHTRGKLNNLTEIPLKNKAEKAFQVSISRMQFDREGVATITLFDDRGIPLAERLVFIENKKQRLNISIKTDKTNYKKREKVTLELEAKDADGRNVATDLTLNVINDTRIAPPQYSEHLMSYLLLKSDLNGYIENPSYYFTEDKAAKRRLDNLMLTQGWRRFTWQQVADTAAVPKYLPEFGLFVEGVVTNSKKPVKNVNLLVSMFDATQNGQSLYCETNVEGVFKLPAYFNDTTRIYVNPLGFDKPIQFTLSDSKQQKPQLTAYTALPEPITNNIEKYLAAAREEQVAAKQRTEKEIMLQEVTIKEKKIQRRDPRSFFYTFPDRSAKMDKDREGLYANALDFVLGSGVVRYKTNYAGRVEFQPLRGINNFSGTTTPLVMIDGVVVEVEALSSIPARNVERVDVIAGARSSALLGSRGAGGAVNVLTRRNNAETKQTKDLVEPKNQHFETTLGYSLVKQFYSPDYGDPKPEHSIEDHRNTIYWSGTVRTDESGRATVIFYNTDDAAQIRIFTEGYNAAGKTGVASSLYKVE